MQVPYGYFIYWTISADESRANYLIKGKNKF